MRDVEPAGSEELAGSWYESDSEFHSLFQDGKVLPLGATFRRPEMAKTLSILAQQGPNAFYEGEIAEGIVDVVKKWGGSMELSDLRGQWNERWYELIEQIIDRDGASQSKRHFGIIESGRCLRPLQGLSSFLH